MVMMIVTMVVVVVVVAVNMRHLEITAYYITVQQIKLL
jgi:hypothetical protein